MSPLKVALYSCDILLPAIDVAIVAIAASKWPSVVIKHGDDNAVGPGH